MPPIVAKQAPLLKIDYRRGLVSGLVIGDTISKVLTYVQLNVEYFGRMEIVAAKEELK